MVERTEATEKWYSVKASEIANAFRSRTGLSSQSDMLTWLASHRTTMTAASWRLYRAALGYEFEKRGFSEMAREIRALGTEQCLPAKSSHKARRKQKKLPIKDHRRINEVLMSSRSRYAEIIGLMLEASRLTGLRPIEWAHCYVDDSNPAAPTLIVQNAKVTNGRSHGPYRKLRLDNLTRNERRTVRTMAKKGYEHRDHWEHTFKQARKTLGRITHKLWPRRKKKPSLYTSRHQFAADAKAANLSQVEIAALMGHADVKTASQHYGRTTAGTRGGTGFRIDPDPGDIQSVLDMIGAKTTPEPDQSVSWNNRPDPDGLDLG